MSGIPHDHYEPKTGAEKWLDSRLPIVGLIYNTIMIPTPKNLTGVLPGAANRNRYRSGDALYTSRRLCVRFD